MTNFQVYRKTLSFSLLEFLVDMFALAVLAGCCTAGFFIADNTPSSRALIGLVIGLVVGIILDVLISVFISNRIKAAQIAMMTKGVTEDELPDHPFHAGFQEIRGRFGAITAFFFITNAIKGIFRELGRAINQLGTAIGGDVGNGITSAIDSAVQTLISYLCDCCLGWILFRKDVIAAKAGCEGAVIFFKHGKTLARNVGRIFGMGFLSLLIIGGGFFGLSYWIFTLYPGMFERLIAEISDLITRNGGTVPELFQNTTFTMLLIAGIVGIIIWGILHSVLIRPFILTGVLRNFMAAGIKDIPTEQDFAELDSKSSRFAKLHKSYKN
ncbi:MAG: hypothetical protein K5925_02040 [Bacilli bacterium]|nr:hypothetical protein [Bacilli bacterium]